jgi:hypothetical protein
MAACLALVAKGQVVVHDKRKPRCDEHRGFFNAEL